MEGNVTPEQLMPEGQFSQKSNAEGVSPAAAPKIGGHGFLSNLLEKMNPFKKGKAASEVQKPVVESSPEVVAPVIEPPPLKLGEITDGEGAKRLEYMKHLAQKGKIGGAEDKSQKPLERDLVVEIKKEGWAKVGSFGGYYSGEKRKKKKDILERQAGKIVHVYTPPRVEIIGKGKKKG